MSNCNSLAVLYKAFFLSLLFTSYLYLKEQLSSPFTKNDKESDFLFQERDRKPDFSISKICLSLLEERLRNYHMLSNLNIKNVVK